MLEDYYDTGTFYKTLEACLAYVERARDRANPMELLFIKDQLLSSSMPESKPLLELIEGAVDLAVHHAVTTLLYRAKRHDFSAPQCQSLIAVITRLNPGFLGYDKKDFEYYIYGEELKRSDYFSDLVNDYDFDRTRLTERGTTRIEDYFYDSDEEGEDEDRLGGPPDLEIDSPHEEILVDEPEKSGVKPNMKEEEEGSPGEDVRIIELKPKKKTRTKKALRIETHEPPEDERPKLELDPFDYSSGWVPLCQGSCRMRLAA